MVFIRPENFVERIKNDHADRNTVYRQIDLLRTLCQNMQKLYNAVFWDVLPCRYCDLMFWRNVSSPSSGWKNPRARNQREQVAAAADAGSSPPDFSAL
jgi:hypothetical protein